MSSIIGRCGIKCHECPAYQAYHEDDNEKRIQTAKEWTNIFNTQLEASDINCSGCLNESVPHFQYKKNCKISPCCKAKNQNNCAFCSEYPCKKLSYFFEWCSFAQPTLEEIRKNL